ncbi:MAG TPA: hypothetical protein DCL08_01940 [Anaerolineaceae bacterium]|nr:hypothetical protein [Anaerolineaceae bacterium]
MGSDAESDSTWWGAPLVPAIAMAVWLRDQLISAPFSGAGKVICVRLRIGEVQTRPTHSTNMKGMRPTR